MTSEDIEYITALIGDMDDRFDLILERLTELQQAIIDIKQYLKI